MQQTNIDQIQLIRFFSRHNADYIGTKEGKKELIAFFGAKDWRALMRLPEYNQNYESIETLRKELDSRIKGFSGMEQVQRCLALLRKKFNKGLTNHFEILMKWIKHPDQECLFNSWTDPLKNYFDEAYRVIFEWKDFFFSYTRRNLPETNNNFKDILIHTFDEKEFQENKSQVNFLAKLLVKYLKHEHLEPFFDLDNMKCGDDIGEKIYVYCKSSFVFIQLIEVGIFGKPEKDKENWCHLEFEKFNEWIEETPKGYKRHFFILTHKPESVLPILRIEKYDRWLDKIKALRYVAIIHGLNNFEIYEKMRELVGEISITKNGIIQNYLGDFFEP